MELKKIIFFCTVLCFLPLPAFGEKETIPEATEERARVDAFLTMQEKGKPVQGKVIQKRLGTDSKVIQDPLDAKADYPKISGNPLVGRKTHLPRKSRFEPDLIKQPLQTRK